ncbi:MAG: hypothetical protein Q4E65_02050 [Clostridia bacterium]|nr:hypothetical protein [Clostridia bacterium]
MMKRLSMVLLAALLFAGCAPAVTAPAPTDAPEAPQQAALQQEEAPFGKTYAFEECLYMNPLSSAYPFEGTGQLYVFKENGLTILDEATGESVESHGTDETVCIDVTDDAWKEMYFVGEPVDIGAYETRRAYSVGDQYRLYCMDAEVWLGKLANDGMLWSVYKLKPAE